MVLKACCPFVGMPFLCLQYQQSPLWRRFYRPFGVRSCGSTDGLETMCGGYPCTIFMIVRSYGTSVDTFTIIPPIGGRRVSKTGHFLWLLSRDQILVRRQKRSEPDSSPIASTGRSSTSHYDSPTDATCQQWSTRLASFALCSWQQSVSWGTSSYSRCVSRSSPARHITIGMQNDAETPFPVACKKRTAPIWKCWFSIIMPQEQLEFQAGKECFREHGNWICLHCTRH